MRRLLRPLLVGVVVTLMLSPSGLVAGGLVESVASHPSGSSGSAVASTPTPSSSGTGPPSAAEAAGTGGLQAAETVSPCASASSFPTSTASALSPSKVDAALAAKDAAGSSPATIAPAASAAVSSAEAAGACPSALFPPRPPATAAELAAARANGSVEPLYTGTPSPIGLADYGLSVLPNGTHVASVLETTKVRGQADLNATGVEPLDLYNSELGPDAYSLQLNAVLTKVVLFGQSGYEFWTQNVMEYYPSAHRLYLITNVWNFSSPAGEFSLGNAIYAHGANGTNFGEVYEAAVGFTGISYPFDLSLYLNSTLVGGRDAVYFTGVLHGPGESIDAPFDYVVFNSIGTGGIRPSTPAVYAANGTGYDPLGLTNDFELDFGGPGDGSQATLVAGDATLGLAYWDPAAHGGLGGYEAVPSAYNYGGETGETSTGATVTWSNAPGGPGGVAAYATMATGPAVLEGLWNATGPEGAYPVTIDSSPSNAFELVTPLVHSPWSQVSPAGRGGPSARSFYAEAYSPALGATILFGGWNPVVGPLGDTWEFADGVWTNVTAPGGPPARWGAQLVYDAADGYLLLFGGRSVSPEVLNDTWIYDASGWHELSTTHAPPARAFASAAYDAADSEVVLFGGGVGTANSSWRLDRDTWTFSGGEWTNITATAGTAPPGRIQAAMTYDATDGELVLAGGASNGQTNPCAYTLPGTWVFSGGQWAELTPSGTVPPPGEGALWFDSATGTTYYYEGVQNLSSSGGSCAALVGDVYAFDAGAWKLLEAGPAPGGPAARFGVEVVDDPAAHLELLFGGQGGVDGPFYADTWSFNPNATSGPPPPQLVPETSVGLTVTTDTFWLAPGTYALETELSGYVPVNVTLNVSGPMTVTPTLVRDPSEGIYTPIWAWSNSQYAAISNGGSGVPASPYVLEYLPSEEIGAAFGLYNDYGYPVYAGMFLLDTTASVEVEDAPTFTTATNDFQSPGPFLPQNNSLPLWFWNVSGVVLTGGVEIGSGETWLSEVGPFAVVFYDSSDNLVDHNTFLAPAGAVLFQFGPGPAAFTGSAGNNTVWGNTFGEGGFVGEIGIVEVEPNDLIYNNKFLTAVTACSPGDASAPNYCWPVYSFTNVSFSDRWNITPEAASNVSYAAGFPGFPLSGSIIGTPDQGGNYWWDYGIYPNTFGVLPYDEKAFGGFIVYITPGGDYAPLVLPTVVTFYEYGLPLKALERAGWTVVLGGVAEHTASYSLSFDNVEPGNNSLLVLGPRGYRTNESGFLSVYPGNQTYFASFVRGATYTLTVVEKGLAVGTTWCPAVDGYARCSTTRTVRFSGLPASYYNVSVDRPSTVGMNLTATMFGGAANLSGLPVYLSERLTLAFAYPVRFVESGLPVGSLWYVDVHGQFGGAFVSPDGSTIVLNLTNGTHTFRVGAPGGYAYVGHRRVVVDGTTVMTLVFRPRS